MIKVLVVEDNIDLNKSINNMLEKERYMPLDAYTLKQAQLIFEEEKPDIVLLDILLPDGKGYDIIPVFTKVPNVSVIVISAVFDTALKKLSYENGAVDYITKPFDMFELIYKLAAIRKRLLFESDQFVIGDVLVDINKRTIKCDESVAFLPQSQAGILKMLHQKMILKTYLSKDEILSSKDSGLDESTRIHTLITRLRANIVGIKSENVVIESVYGKGYRLDIAE